MIMSACWPLQHMSPVQKSVLISLADNANDQGVCWPSIATIGKRTCVSERAVQNAIKWLEQHGLLTANRANGRHTSYTVTPASYSPPQDMHPRTKCTGAADAPTPAADAGDPRTGCVAPPHQMPTNRKEPSEEPSLNRQPARRAPRVALHGQILNLELPDWLPFDSWDAWCEHREAKAKDAPWTLAAAKVSIKRIKKLLDAGQSVETTIDEAVLRGWTGLFPVRAEATQTTAGTTVPAGWHKTVAGVTEQGKQLGIEQGEGEVFMRFKARVVKAAGPGEWMEDMLRDAARFGDEQYEALYGYFNDIPREKPALAEAA
jgi:hypothetical protein